MPDPEEEQEDEEYEEELQEEAAIQEEMEEEQDEQAEEQHSFNSGSAHYQQLLHVNSKNNNNSQQFNYFYSPKPGEDGVAGANPKNTNNNTQNNDMGSSDFINVYFDLERELKLSKEQDIGFHIPSLMHKSRAFHGVVGFVHAMKSIVHSLAANVFGNIYSFGD